MRAEVSLEHSVQRIEGPLLFLERKIDLGLNSLVEVLDRDGRSRVGRITALDDTSIVVEVLESTLGLGVLDTRLRVSNEPLMFGVGPGLLGRTFDSIGRPTDGGGPIASARRMRIDGLAINPAARALPRDFIETGVSSIDLMNSLVRGQKLPLFSGAGLPHERLATQIALHARLLHAGAGEFAIVFVGMGIAHDTAEAFRDAMASSAALEHTAMFLNLADEPATRRLLTPRYALTAAEYLAFVEGRHVLVVMIDMTNYCEALREVSASHGEIPSRKGYPGYMYSDLASLYERAGCIQGLPGTLTQLPILSMPGDDISHPIPDLTGYITEGQIVLDRELDRRGIYPPVRVLPSLSRLMNSGIGAGFTHPDHPALANQLFASYARAVQVRLLASVMGEDSLPDLDRSFLAFGRAFEEQLLNQQEPRTLEQSMAARLAGAAWPARHRAYKAVAATDRSELEASGACLRARASSPSVESGYSSSRTSSAWCKEGYELLDQKRILLATEIHRQLLRLRRLRAAWRAAESTARDSLAAALDCHGLDELSVYPPHPLGGERLSVARRRLLGLELLDASLDTTAAAQPGEQPVNPSPEARHCVRAHLEWLGLAVQYAACCVNLRRLAREYVRTERRARAIENILLPEIAWALKLVDEQLESLDQEEIARLRHRRAARPGA